MRILIPIAWLVFLLPICALLGYGIGLLLAPIWYVERVDRELFAGVYGILFLGSGIYAVAAALVIYRATRSRRS